MSKKYEFTPQNVLAVTRLRALKLEALTKFVDLERDSVANKSRWRGPDGYSVMMLVGTRLRHISTTKWGTRQYLCACKIYEQGVI